METSLKNYKGQSYLSLTVLTPEQLRNDVVKFVGKENTWLNGSGERIISSLYGVKTLSWGDTIVYISVIDKPAVVPDGRGNEIIFSKSGFMVYGRDTIDAHFDKEEVDNIV